MSDDKKKKDEKQKKSQKKNRMQVSYEFGESDFESAIQKLTEAAWKYDKNMPGAVSMSAFEGQSMEPHVFKEQLFRVLNMKLSPKELGALMSYFDKNGDGRISCPEFLIQFIKVGFEERSRRRQAWRQFEERRAKARKRKEEEKEMEAEQKNNLKITYDFTENDFQSAISKLTAAAVKYDRHAAGAVGLDAFEGEAMLPHVFKEQLKRVFNIRLSPPELGALMSYFDKDGDGCINCAEFLIQFFRTGFEQRGKIRSYWRQVKKAKAAKKSKEEEERIKENEARAMAEVDFNFTEEQFDSALMIVIKMCYHFEHRQLGPAGLKAFEADMVTPSEFREMLKRSFNIILNSHQLGALVTYWDPTMIGMVSCRAFLNSFTQMRVRTESFKNKPGLQKKLDDYHTELKEKYKQRIQKQMNQSGERFKPWRVNSTIALSSDPPPKKPYPSTPSQKVNRRLAVAKRTGRLDLSTVVTAQEKAQNDQGAAADEQKVSVDVDDTAVPTTQTILSKGTAKETVEYFLEEIPVEVFSIKMLRELWLCNNPLRTISLKLSQCQHLNILSLQNVGLSTIPSVIFSLKELRQLFLQRNAISDIPDEISSLSNLTDLSLSKNSLTGTIPTNLTSFKQLSLLDISNNDVEFIPTELVTMSSLALLNLDFTSVKEIPAVISRRMPHLIISGVPMSKPKYTAASYGISADEEKEFVNFIKKRCKKSAEKLNNNDSTTNDDCTYAVE